MQFLTLNKDAKITCDKKASLKGKVIRLSGSKGVTAKGKQVAVEQDKVFGMDTHIKVVPAGPSTATVPIPHPFIGKLLEKLSLAMQVLKMRNEGCSSEEIARAANKQRNQNRLNDYIKNNDMASISVYMESNRGEKI
nr:hypothetical protein [Treponema sp.]